MPAGSGRNTVSLLFGITPIAVFMYVYQRHARTRFHVWEIPAVSIVFTLYTYVWIFATVRALARNATGRRNWVKTPRVDEQLPSSEPALAQLPAAR